MQVIHIHLNFNLVLLTCLACLLLDHLSLYIDPFVLLALYVNYVVLLHNSHLKLKCFSPFSCAILDSVV